MIIMFCFNNSAVFLGQNNVIICCDSNCFEFWRFFSFLYKIRIITVFSQNEQAVLDYLKNNAVQINLAERENPIHFGLLGNGITVYDTSKWDKENKDYPTIAHISDEGIVNYWVEKNTLKAEDITLIEKQAERQKQEFMDSWNKLPIEKRYARIQDGANGLPKPQWEIFFADKVGLSEEETVKKYEHSIIFHDEDFPEAEKSLTAYRIGDFYEFYGEDAHISSDLLGLTETMRQGKPMTGFPVHTFDKYRRDLALQGYYLKTGDEREIEKILNTISQTPKNIAKSLDELRVGDLVCGDGAIWRVTKIDGDFSINFENTDKTSNVSVQSFIGHWKSDFSERGFEFVNPAELTSEQLREINTPRQKPKKAEKTPQTVSEDYGEQLSLFGEPTHEVDVPKKNYIGGIDVDKALSDELTLHGTTFTDGKFRIEEYYLEHKGNTEGFAKILAKEYGVGGHSGEGKIQLISYDSKGIKMRVGLDNGGATTLIWNWKKVADRVATLIDKGEYITQFDIDKRIKRAQSDYTNFDKNSELYKQAEKILDNYGLLQAPEINEETEELKRAKELINDFCDREHDSVGDFSDLSCVPLAYTQDEETMLPIQVNADLENFRLIYLFNDEVVKTEQYSSLAEMNEQALKWLSFDELVNEAIDAKQNEILDEKTAEPIKTSDIEKPAEKPAEIKNLAQLKRALTVGAEFEITSAIRPDINKQLRQVKYADTTGIYSIRPDAPDDRITLANDGRGSYLDWGKAADWDFNNGDCIAYRKGMEHTPENTLFTIRLKPRVIEKEITETPKQQEKTENKLLTVGKEFTFENRQYRIDSITDREVKFLDLTMLQQTGMPIFRAEPIEYAEIMAATAEQERKKETPAPKLKEIVIDLTPRGEKEPDIGGNSLSDLTKSNIIERLSKAFSNETANKLLAAFEKSKMPDWNSNSAKINRIKRALYNILGNESQTERAFGIITSAIHNAHDFTITDEHLGEGGQKAKFAANIAAIQTLKQIESENRLATSEEQKTLSKYVGWGGLPQAFDPANKQWANEYEQLKKLLTEDEYRAASSSTLNAHYTTPTVIQAIYKGLQNLGFEGGNILEPSCGVGNFFGCMPEDLREKSNLSGVELDSITGRIAKQLYPSADIQIKGFEKTDFSDNYFDVAVGNVPFGSYSVSDKRYNRENFFIHDYFLAKTLDKVAPGGIVAIITTKGTLDKENPRVREYLAKRADLVGAVRLPNNAFKANAGTEVTTDILFLQKRKEMAVEMPDWCYISNNANGVPVNNYFIDHPEMVLGTMKQGIEFSLYGNEKETACVPIEGADLAEQLEKAVANLKINNALRIHHEQSERQAGIIPAVADVRNFTFAEVDGKIYFRENNVMTEVTGRGNTPVKGKTYDNLKAFCELRKTFRTILSAQENDCSDEQLQAYQKILNEQYDAFVKKFGCLNSDNNNRNLSKDDDYNLLCALEVVDEETKQVSKSDFFSKRTVKHFTEITHVDTPQEAMHVAIDTLGKLDLSYMAKLCGKEPREVIDALQADNLIYLNPNKANAENELEGWEETSEYLSGNVRIKLRAAELAAKDNPDFKRNVDALTAVIPKRIEAGDISARIGVHWVDVEDYQKFLEEYAQARFSQPLRRAVNGEYKISNKGWDTSTAATQLFGTKRINSLEIFENLLNNRDVVVRDKVYDPYTEKEHYEINRKETELAQDKASKMKDAFARWLWADPERREKYVTRYNELFNSIVGREYDGSHQTFPGMSPYIKLKPHQLNAVARAKFGGNTLLAHCVGAGKSFEMVAATMEKKRLGLINKACVVVPKNLVGQMASEWLRLYPQAKILTATEKDFDKNHRQKFIGRCCTGEYDAVIMSYEQFEKISMSFEYRRDFIRREIKRLAEGIKDLEDDYKNARENQGSIKDMERLKKRLEDKLSKLIEDNGKKKDTFIDFEQLGFDSLVVDEAHNYKNGLVVTKMNRVAGVQTTPAQKSEDILMKTQYLNDNYGEKNILFATGTPVAGLQQLNTKFNFNSVFVGNFHNLNHRRGYLALFFKR